MQTEFNKQLIRNAIIRAESFGNFQLAKQLRAKLGRKDSWKTKHNFEDKIIITEKDAKYIMKYAKDEDHAYHMAYIFWRIRCAEQKANSFQQKSFQDEEPTLNLR